MSISTVFSANGNFLWSLTCNSWCRKIQSNTAHFRCVFCHWHEWNVLQCRTFEQGHWWMGSSVSQRCAICVLFGSLAWHIQWGFVLWPEHWKWNDSSVMSMEGMSNEAVSLDQPIGNLNVTFKFSWALSFNLEIGDWDVSYHWHETCVSKKWVKPLKRHLEIGYVFGFWHGLNVQWGIWTKLLVAGMFLPSMMWNTCLVWPSPSFRPFEVEMCCVSSPWNPCSARGFLLQSSRSTFNKKLGEWNVHNVFDVSYPTCSLTPFCF